jgi:hypothetical protein
MLHLTLPFYLGWCFLHSWSQRTECIEFDETPCLEQSCWRLLHQIRFTKAKSSVLRGRLTPGSVTKFEVVKISSLLYWRRGEDRGLSEGPMMPSFSNCSNSTPSSGSLLASRRREVKFGRDGRPRCLDMMVDIRSGAEKEEILTGWQRVVKLQQKIIF